MNNKLIIAGTSTAALLIGIGIGGAAEATSSSETAEPETIVKTIRVPGPTETETVTETVTETETVERTPQACLDAIDAAERIATVQSDFVQGAIKTTGLIPKAYRAGVLGLPVDGIISSLEENTARTEELTERMNEEVGAFNAAKTICRSRR